MFIFKFLFKSIFYLALIAILLVVCLSGLGIWLAPHYVPPIVTTYVEKKTDFDMEIKKLNISLLGGGMEMRGIYLYNPSQYEEREFVHVRELSGKVQLGTLLGDRIVLDDAVVDVTNVTVVRNDANQMNVNDFQKGFVEESLKPSVSNCSASKSSSSSKESVQYLIKKLTIKMGSFSVVGIPDKTSDKQDFTINYERTFTDVTDMSVVANAVGDDLKKYGVQVLVRGLLQQVNPEDIIKNFSDFGINGVSGVEQAIKDNVRENVNSIKKKCQELI